MSDLGKQASTTAQFLLYINQMCSPVQIILQYNPKYLIWKDSWIFCLLMQKLRCLVIFLCLDLYITSSALRENIQQDSGLCFIICSFFGVFFFNWDLPHARLNSHFEVWSYKKNKQKKITGYRKSVQKEPTVKRCLLILDLKPLKSQVKGKHFIGREFQSLAV